MVDKCDHDPVEQVRGKMKHEDYFDVLANDLDHAKIERWTYKHPGESYADYVELNDDNRTDMRIICTKCHMTTGWNRVDAPNMPGVGLEFTRRKWTEMTK